MSNFNTRIPLVGLQNRKKNENSGIIGKSASKIADINNDPFKFNNNGFNTKNFNNASIFPIEKKDGKINVDNNSNSCKVNDIDNYGNYNSKQKNLQNEDEILAKEEHYKCTIKALKDAIDENESLREKLKLIVEENEELKAENEEKTNALLELAEYYEFCKKNHTDKDICNCKINKRRGSDNDINLNRKRRKSNSL